MTAGRAATVRLLALAMAAFVFSQFFRVAPAVVAPEWLALGLGADTVGVVSGAYFLAFAAVQVPVGLALDRWGARRTVGGLLLVAALGALAMAAGQGTLALVGAQAVIGLGCSAVFMGGLVLAGHWFPAERFAPVSSWLLAAGNVGALLATAPLAAVVAGVGWRGAYVGAGLLTLAVALAFLALVRDRPPGRAPPAPESLRAALGGLGRVIGDRRVWALLPLCLIGYASTIALRGLWAGPYLAEVHGLGTVLRGELLLVMALASVLGTLGAGYLVRPFGGCRRPIGFGAAVSVALLAVLSLWPAPPWPVAVALLTLLCLSGSVYVLLYTHIKGFVAEALTGRALTLANLMVFAGIFVLQVAGGLIVDAVSEPGPAYRAVFALIALAVAGAALAYWRAPDVGAGTS